MENYKKLIEKINHFKKEKNAIILVHNYQRPEIYEVADYIGDSLGLSRKAVETEKEIIVFCGVRFMAETAKILSPNKTVLLPSFDAGCPMADMIRVEELKEFKRQHPDVAVVAYVNTSAEVKAEVDVCCTSGNAVEIVNNLKEDKILFVPDKNLGDYVQSKTNKEIILWDGHCYVHNRILEETAKLVKKYNPDSIFIAHPECSQQVLRYADEVGSTEKMVEIAKANKGKHIVLATEEGMINRLRKENPDNNYSTIGGMCFNMKKTTLQNVYDALKKNQHRIDVPENVRVKAKKALDRMISIG